MKAYVLNGMLLGSLVMGLSDCKTTPVKEQQTEVTQADSVIINEDPGVVDAPVAETTADPEVIVEKNEVVKKAPLKLIINGLESSSAPVFVGVYNIPGDFPDPDKQLKEYKFRPSGKQLRAEIVDLKFGAYALAIYQDANNNGKIDKNMIGIPTEGYAFSNNYKPVVKAPNFDNCKFEYNAVSNTITMNLIN